ncbi:MAG: hypothetical protein OHK0023_22930 [Anaerolineae bacterium]
MSQPQSNSHSDNRLEVLLAILIAVASVMTALITWRAFVAGDNAGDSDFAGIAAALNAENTRTSSVIRVFDNYSAFADFKQYSVLAEQLAADIAKLPADHAALQSLQAQLDQTLTLLSYARERFDNRFLTRSGNFDFQRNFGELFSEAARIRDHNPDPHFNAADKFREKYNFLQFAAIFPAAGLIFFALTEIFRTRIRYLMLVSGLGLMLMGGFIVIFVEIASR